MKQLVFVTILFLLFFTRSFWFHAGVPYTHDGENHLARFANYKIALREGQFPPRFAPNLLNHYGYPVFNYNYPLANILSVPFSLLKFHYEVTYKLLILLSLAFGSFGVLRWLSQYSIKKLPILAAIIAYLSGPPLISTLLFRGSIGEIMAYALWPWLLLSSTAASKKLSQRSTVLHICIWTAFLLAHNISVFIAVFVFAIIGVWQMLIVFERKRYVLQMFTIVICAIGLSLWFWLPAIGEMKQVVVSQAANQREYLLHFPTIKQLLYSPLFFGYSYSGPVDTLSYWLGWITPICIFALTIIALNQFWCKQFSFRKYLRAHKSQVVPISVFLLLFCIVIQMPFSSWIWKTVPNFRLIQFPWRFGLLTTIFSLPLLVWLLQSRSKLITGLIWLTIFLQLLGVSQAKPIDYIAKQKFEYDLHGGTTSTQNENVPFGFTYLLIADWQPSPSILSGEAYISTVENWNGSNRLYRLDVMTPSVIVEPTMNYLGWETKVRALYSDDNSFKLITYQNSDEIQGRIAYSLEPGLYQVSTRFTQNTWARHIGNVSFIITLGALIVSYLWHKFRL